MGAQLGRRLPELLEHISPPVSVYEPRTTPGRHDISAR